MTHKLKTISKRPIEMTPQEAAKSFPDEVKANNRYAVIEKEFEKVFNNLLRAAGRKQDKLVLQLAHRLHEVEQEQQSLLREHSYIIDGGWPKFLAQHNITLKIPQAKAR